MPPQAKAVSSAKLPPGALAWEQLPDEPAGAFRAFKLYLEMGYARSVHAVNRAIREQEGRGLHIGEDGVKTTRTGGTSAALREWALRYQWRQRAMNYDHALALATERARLKHAEELERNRLRALQKRDNLTIDIAQQLKVKALRMLAWPLEETTEESRTIEDDGRTIRVVTVVKPAKWTMRDAAYFLELARQMEDAVYHPETVRLKGVNRQGVAPTGAEASEGGLQAGEAGGSGEESADGELAPAVRQTLGQWWAHQQRRILDAPAPPETPSMEAEGENGQEGPSDRPEAIGASATSDLSSPAAPMRPGANQAAQRANSGPSAVPFGTRRPREVSSRLAGLPDE